MKDEDCINTSSIKHISNTWWNVNYSWKATNEAINWNKVKYPIIRESSEEPPSYINQESSGFKTTDNNNFESSDTITCSITYIISDDNVSYFNPKEWVRKLTWNDGDDSYYDLWVETDEKAQEIIEYLKLVKWLGELMNALKHFDFKLE